MVPVPTLYDILHPQGESPSAALTGQNDTFVVQTPGGVFHVTYDADAEVSHLGGIVPFAQFIQASGLFAGWVADAPLTYASNRALGVRDILGTQVLSMLCGHSRFAHITALRGDSVTPRLLGMEHVASEDAVRRAMLRLVQDEAAQATSMTWLRRHMRQTLEPMLSVPWTLDIDVTVKPVYGYQEGSVVGYNPQKQGRPSHALHAFIMAQTRLVLDVSVHPGNESSSADLLPELKRVVTDLPRDRWPALLRGDCGFGTDNMMTWCESVHLMYLFKQKMTKNTAHLVNELQLQTGWIDVGKGWEGTESTLQLSTWNTRRRAIVFRRPNPGPRYQRAKDIAAAKQPKQEIIMACQSHMEVIEYEYQVLVTTLTEPIHIIFQRYRDRGDCENVFDEIKNHWGWGGFTSHTFAVTQAVALISALVYNWWSIFCRLADPTHHREAITTRPTLLHGVIRQTSHSNQRILTITSTNGNKATITSFFNRVSSWLANLITNAEHWTSAQRWEAMIKAIFAGPMGVIAPPTG